MHFKTFLNIFICSLVFIACSDTREGWEKHVRDKDALNAQLSITSSSLESHITTLSSDEFQGRFPGTVGEVKTIQYLIDNFSNMGLQPGNPNGEWIQKATMTGVTSELRAQFITDKERSVLMTGKDIIGNSFVKKNKVNLLNKEIIFCGYGVFAPEYEWNDFKDVDVKGKIIVVLVNDPPVTENGELDDDYFGGKAMTYYGRWSYKFEEGLRRGAAGVIVVHETEAAGYPFSVLQNSYKGEQLTIVDPSKTPLSFQGWIPKSTANKLFSMSGYNFDDQKALSSKKDFKPIVLNAKFTSRINNRSRTFSSNNFVGKYEGNDPVLKNEYIIYTAHWDHLGIDRSLDGDQVYNGANDNALGTGIVIDAAKAFSKLKKGTKRSILFLAVTAEEQGLLGSNFYNINPLYPLEKTVAVINIDAMGNTYGKTKDLIVVGKGNSNLDQVLEFAAKQDRKYLVPNPSPEKGFYYRSDHFPFAKNGIPSLYVGGGVDVVGKGKDFGLKMQNRYNSDFYHQVGDEILDDWDFAGTEQDARILFRVGYAISQHTEWPQWSEGNEFRATREKMLSKLD